KREGTVDIKASFKNLRQEDIGAVKVGDKEVLSDGTVLTEVVRVGVPEPNYFLVKNFRSWPDKDPYLHMMTGDGRFTLPVVLRLRGYVINKNFVYRAGTIGEDSYFIFNPGSYRVWVETDV
ncbi:MAG: hypothetical protein PHS37_08405, partial [Candidatus Omnitrophica bacterium]|nr:hypothetical protein [Candidatus Omnitrophota bacterium]